MAGVKGNNINTITIISAVMLACVLIAIKSVFLEGEEVFNNFQYKPMFGVDAPLHSGFAACF